MGARGDKPDSDHFDYGFVDRRGRRLVRPPAAAPGAPGKLAEMRGRVGRSPPAHLHLFLFLAAGSDVDGELTVEATLRVIHHPAKVCGGRAFPRFTECRLVGATPSAL